METSPSFPSTSYDSSTGKYKSGSTEGVFIDRRDGKHVNDTSFVAESDLNKEAHCEGTLEGTRSKLDSRRVSASAKHRSSGDFVVNASSSTDLDMPSEASTEDCYFKRAQRHVDAKPSYADTDLQESVEFDYCCRSNKSDEESGKSDNHSHTVSPADDRGCNKTELQRTELPFPGKGISSDAFMKHQSDLNFPKSGYEATQEQRDQSLATEKHAIVENRKTCELATLVKACWEV